MNTKQLKFCLLIIITLQLKIKGIETANNPCPQIFQYTSRGGLTNFGEITVPYDGSKINEINVTVSYPFQDILRDLQLDLETSFEDIVRKGMFKYLVTFPYQHILPSVVRIVYNDRIICARTTPLPSFELALWKTNSFFIFNMVGYTPLSGNKIIHTPLKTNLGNQFNNDGVFGSDILSSPCPNVFQYRKKNKYIYGEITIPNNNLQEFNLSISASIPVFLPKTYEKTNIKITLETSATDLTANKPAKYRVDFPFQNVVTSIHEIGFNGQIYCSNPLKRFNDNEPVTKFSAKIWYKINILGNRDYSTHTYIPPILETSHNSPFQTINISTISTERIPSPITPIQNPGSRDRFPKCGQPKEFAPLVINGRITSYPWLVALFYRFEYQCAANLITDQHVLTAAHCLKFNREDTTVVIGISDLSKKLSSDHRRVQRLIIHPLYNSKTYADIGIIILEQETNFNENIMPICLWSKQFGNSYRTGKVAGWGSRFPELITPLTPDIAYEVTSNIISTEQCLRNNPNFKSLINNTTFCANFNSNSGPCRGDSGGGFMIEIQSKYYIRGLVGTGVGGLNGRCSSDQYIIFDDIESHLDWILDNIQYS